MRLSLLTLYLFTDFLQYTDKKKLQKRATNFLMTYNSNQQFRREMQTTHWFNFCCDLGLRDPASTEQRKLALFTLVTLI